jgi:hypothetical protein
MLEFPVYAIESKNYSRKKMNEKATISKLSDKIKVKVDLNNLAKISIVSKNIYIYIYISRGTFVVNPENKDAHL